MPEIDDSLSFEFIVSIGKKESYKSIKDYTNYLESQLGQAFDTSLLNPLNKAGTKWNALIKQGKQYRELVVGTTKKGALTSFSIGKQKYSKTEAEKLISASSISGVKTLRDDIAVERREKARRKAENKKAEQEALKIKENRAKTFANLIGETMTGKDRIRFNISQQQSVLKGLQKEFESVDAGSQKFKDLQSEIKKTQKNINGLKKDLEKETKVSWFEKLVNTFKRVGFYRLARRLFQVIEQGLSESITNLAKFDSGVNDTMSSLTSSFTILSNSLGVVIAPLLKIVEPILNGLAKTVGSVANAIGYLLAKLTGSSKLLKVNTEYLKDFNKEIQTLSFDKFESLDESADIGSMFEEVDLESTSFLGELAGAKEELAKIDELLITIGGTLAGYASYKFVDWIVSGKAKTFFTDADTGLGKIKKKIDDISSAGLIASSAFAFVTSIINLIDVIKNWDSQSLVTKITAIVSVCLALFAVIASILSAVLPTGPAKVFKAIAIGTTAGATLTGVVSAMRFAEGGRPEAGSLFIAGEAGAELVTTMPSGQTGVTNIAQFRQATVEALYEWWSDAKYDIPEGSTTYLDGAQIARSKSFKNELNRTNSGLNLR